MKKIRVQRLGPESAKLNQLKATREWMDNTAEKHAYMCFPLTLTNGLGWGISFDRDIRAIWDGIENYEPDHVTILEGEDIVYTGRSHASLSFKTGLIFNTDKNTSILTMPVPNQFMRGMQTFTTLMSTSFYPGDLPLAIKITEPNKEIFIPAGTPVAAIIPLSVAGLQNDYEMEITEGPMPPEYWEELKKYNDDEMKLYPPHCIVINVLLRNILLHLHLSRNFFDENQINFWSSVMEAIEKLL
jgi:hypothetical protein